MGTPIPYRTKSNSSKNIGSFPPPSYYRDTYGLQQLNERVQVINPISQKPKTDSLTTIASDDSVTTKSTVKTTRNVQNLNLMVESLTSKDTANTQSFRIEQMITNHILIINVRTLLTLSLISFASAVQLLIFAIICKFYDGCPYNIAIIMSFIFIFNSVFIIYFIRYKSSRFILLIGIFLSAISFICAVTLFIWTAYLIGGEDRNIRQEGWSFYKENLLEANHLVTNTRIAMYSLQMILSPMQALCCAGILKISLENLQSTEINKIQSGYFFSQPYVGHQTVLVPIELKQVDCLDESDVENASVGVQTSGYQDSKAMN